MVLSDSEEICGSALGDVVNRMCMVWNSATSRNLLLDRQLNFGNLRPPKVIAAGLVWGRLQSLSIGFR